MKDTHLQTDEIVRIKLAELTPPPPSPSGWNALERQLDADADAPLREALTGLSAAAPRGWEALAGRLDAGGQAPATPSVADKLNSLRPTPAPGAWAAFAASMDGRAADAVDGIVHDQLHRVPTPAPTGWAALAARLELIRERRGRIVAGKVTELALMASLVLLFVRFGDLAIDKVVAPASEDSLALLRDAVKTTPYVEAKVDVATEDDVMSPPVGAAAEVAVQSSGNIERKKEQLPPDPRARVIAAQQIDPLPRGAGPDPVKTIETFHPLSDQDRACRRVKPAALRVLTTYNRTVNLAPRLDRPALVMPPTASAGQPTRLYLNAFVSPFDVNQVITKDLPILDVDIEADNRITQGSSAGLLLDIVQGRTGFQFGGIYSEMSYIPSVLKWYLQEEFQAVEPIKGYSRFRYERLDLPFSVTQTISENNRWRWSARATASISVITQSSFDVQNAEDIAQLNDRVLRNPNFLPISEPNANQSRSSAASANPNLYYELVDPPPGYFEGGSFFSNSSFYLGGGIMLERILSTRSSVYFNPSFGRAVYFNANDSEAGTGPYQDRMHSGQLRFGARYMIIGK